MPLLLNFFSVFSIRLGSIIVAAVHLVQGLVLGIASMVMADRNPEELTSQIVEWAAENDLLFMTGIVKNVTENPVEYLHICSGLNFFYVFTCVLLIVGALGLNMWLIIPYVITELARLFFLTGLVVVTMLLVKKNSLDLGLLMGGSIGGGFFLLFLFYLWSCPLSLCQVLYDLRQDAKKPLVKENDRKAITDNKSIKLTDVNLSKPTKSQGLWHPAVWNPDPYTNGAVIGSFYIE